MVRVGKVIRLSAVFFGIRRNFDGNSTDRRREVRDRRIANVMAQRQSTPHFGLGLAAAICDETIKRNALRPMTDGVKGRAAIITDILTGDKRIGRLGSKEQQATWRSSRLLSSVMK